MFIYECEWVVADLDKPKLHEDYEVFYPFVVALPFLLGRCSYQNLNLDVRESALPCPAFFVSQGDSHGGTITFCHGTNKLMADGWVYITIFFKGVNVSFCFPMLWFALLFSISPLKPQSDPCTLLTSLTEDKLELCRMCSEIAITHKNVGKIIMFKNMDGKEETNKMIRWVNSNPNNYANSLVATCKNGKTMRVSIKLSMKEKKKNKKKEGEEDNRVGEEGKKEGEDIAMKEN